MATAELATVPPAMPLRHQQKTISLETIPLIKMQTAESERNIQWEQLQPIQIYSRTIGKWRPAIVIGITEHSTGHYLDVHYWKSARSAKVTAECLDAVSESVRPICSGSTPLQSRDEWTSGSEVECFSESRRRWYLATVVNVTREEADTEDWLELQWLIEHSPTERQVYGKELQRSSELIRHRYPHHNNKLAATISECTVIRYETTQEALMSVDTTRDLDELDEHLDGNTDGNTDGQLDEHMEEHMEMAFSETEESETIESDEDEYEDDYEEERSDLDLDPTSTPCGCPGDETHGQSKPTNDHNCCIKETMVQQ